MRNKTKILLVLMLFVPIMGFAFVPRAVASHGELISFIHIPKFGVNFPSNWNAAPWQTMIESWNPETSRLIMYWWCDPFDDDWLPIDPGPDGEYGTEDDIYWYFWDDDMPEYDGNDEIVIGWGMGLVYDNSFQPLTQQTAKEVQKTIEVAVIIDGWYEVDLRISPVVYVPHAYNNYEEGWPVYFYRVGAVFRAGELKEIIGTGVHEFKLVINDFFTDWNSDDEIAMWKFFGLLPAEAPDTCLFELT
jgi:hypothetical protein